MCLNETDGNHAIVYNLYVCFLATSRNLVCDFAVESTVTVCIYFQSIVE